MPRTGGRRVDGAGDGEARRIRGQREAGAGEEADLGPSTSEETPIVRAATTRAMALDATTDFVLLNRSGFIYSSFSQ